jgi:hypothetical protein
MADTDYRSIIGAGLFVSHHNLIPFTIHFCTLKIRLAYKRLEFNRIWNCGYLNWYQKSWCSKCKSRMTISEVTQVFEHSRNVRRNQITIRAANDGLYTQTKCDPTLLHGLCKASDGRGEGHRLRRYAGCGLNYCC